MITSKKYKKIILSILFFFINYTVAVENNNKIEDDFKIFGCTGCCYPVDDDLCRVFYSGCLTKTLSDSLFLFSENTNLEDDNISRIVRKYYGITTTFPLIMIRNKAIYLLTNKKKKLQDELNDNIKKIESGGAYPEQKLNRLREIKIEKIDVSVFNFSHFTKVLTRYGIIIKASNYTQGIEYYNKNLYEECKLKENITTTSYTNAEITTIADYHYDTTLSTLDDKLRKNSKTSYTNTIKNNNIKITTIADHHYDTTLSTSNNKFITNSNTTFNPFYNNNSNYNIVIILVSIGIVLVIIIVIVVVIYKKISKRKSNIIKNNTTVSLYSLEMNKNLNLSEPHIYEDPYLMDKIEHRDDRIQQAVHSSDRDSASSDIIISSKNLGDNPIVILVEKENCQIIESYDANSGGQQSLLIKMPNKTSSLKSSKKIKDLLNVRDDALETESVYENEELQQNLIQADEKNDLIYVTEEVENNENEENINASSHIYQPLYSILESSNEKNNQELQNKAEDIDLTIDTFEANQNDFNTEQSYDLQ